MKRKNRLVITLVISAFLIVTAFGGLSFNTVAKPDSLEVVKEIFDGDDWVDEIYADIGDTVEFRITITYHNVTEPGHTHYAENIVVTDTLPDGLEYDVGSASPDEPTVVDNVLTWDLGSTRLYDGESYVITFNATVFGYGLSLNHVLAEAYEHCTGMDIAGSDTATVNVIYPMPEIDIDKYVWDGACFWVKETKEYAGETVSFKLVVENTGQADLYDIFINDTLSDSLEYVIDSASPFQPVVDGKTLTWYINTMAPGEIIEITFDAIVIGLPCSVDTNLAVVEAVDGCGIMVSDEDSADVIINGMCMEKEVWDEDIGAWMESTEAAIGDTVRFRITIYYYGPKTLYDIKVTDVLPECFVYADSAIPEEPEVSGNTLWWNLSHDYDLYDGQSLIIEFDADVAGGLCDECVNWAYVIANECSGRIFEWQDPATVYVMMVDAGGPYYGDIDEEITVTGQVFGGTSPYTYEWDLDDDGDYDDSTDKTTTVSFDTAGNHPISLKVTDDNGLTGYDDTVVIIGQGENNPPAKPSKPTGPANGQFGSTYTYKSSTTDADGDQVMYLFDWGDGTNSGWLGPYDSGIICEATHKWSYGSYSIKVKARDIHFEESEWSDPLPISMPRNKAVSNPLVMKLLELLMQRLPILEKILGLYY